jgi:hypothetical protein
VDTLAAPFGEGAAAPSGDDPQRASGAPELSEVTWAVRSLRICEDDGGKGVRGPLGLGGEVR